MQQLDDPRKQRAEISAYFHQFQDAEAIYLEMGRVDLAVNLYMRLGDWDRVQVLIEVCSLAVILLQPVIPVTPPRTFLIFIKENNIYRSNVPQTVHVWKHRHCSLPPAPNSFQKLIVHLFQCFLSENYPKKIKKQHSESNV